MVKFTDIKDESAGKASLDLRKEVERLRIELSLAGGAEFLEVDADDQRAALLAGFQTPDDFTIREQSLEYQNGDSYQGEMLGSLRHGKGVHTCANGDKYDGNWRYDKREGKGKMTFTRGLMYEGEWKDDKTHGHGVARYENGSIYVGDWQNDHRWGWGTQHFPSGEQYEGEWWDDKITGKGRYTYADGSYYEGEWLDGSRVKGKYVAADGSTEYSGAWQDNLRHGYGVQYVRGVYKYMGAWQADVQSGEGKCIYADGTVYDGEWQAGVRHGRGKQTFKSYQYEGEWKDDMQHGSGRCQLDNGDRYIGEFQAGKRHGRGRCVFADGSKYDGQWEEDVRCGKGTCVYANGDTYTGEWQGDRRHGQGVCKFADGTKFRGEWEDDGWVQSAADPAKCRVAGPGVTRAVAGQPAELLIEARDENGNKRLSGGDEFQVHLRGPASVAGTVTDKGDGTYTVTYSTTAAGVYQLQITTGAEEHVADSPYPLRILPARPCARKCTVEGEGRRQAVMGQPASFDVLLYDEYGNRWHGDAKQLLQLLPLEASLTAPSGAECPVSLEPARDGRYICSYTPTLPGYHRLHIACQGGAPLPRTPFSVLVADKAGNGPAGSDTSSSSSSQAGAASQAAQQGACPAVAEPGEMQQAAAACGPAASQAGGSAGSKEVVPDLMRVWERIAQAAFAADGSLDGWDSDSEREKTKESPGISAPLAHPNVPVVENLEDIWKVTRLQNERKAREAKEKQARLAKMRKELESAYGAPAAAPTPEEVTAAVREIVAADRGPAPAPGAGVGGGSMTSTAVVATGGKQGEERHGQAAGDELRHAAAAPAAGCQAGKADTAAEQRSSSAPLPWGRSLGGRAARLECLRSAAAALDD